MSTTDLLYLVSYWSRSQAVVGLLEETMKGMITLPITARPTW